MFGQPISPYGHLCSEQADRTVERLLQAVRRDPVLWNGQAIRCTISIGYACFPMPGTDTEISLESAISLTDKSLYEAKRRRPQPGLLDQRGSRAG